MQPPNHQHSTLGTQQARRPQGAAGTAVGERPDVHAARGFAYVLIAEIFRWPTREDLAAWANPARWTDWPEILTYAYPSLAEDLAALRRLLTLDGSADGSLAELESEYIRLFGHTVRGACPLYELEYGQSEIIQQASFLADIGGFYSAFGLMPASEGHERADHLCVEAEFMSVLAAKEARAADTGDDAGREIIRESQASFLGDHLGRWLPACLRRVREAAPDTLYGRAAAFAAAFLAAECDALGVHIGPELLELRSADPSADTEIHCGAEESCPGSSASEDELVQVNLDPALSRGK